MWYCFFLNFLVTWDSRNYIYLDIAKFSNRFKAWDKPDFHRSAEDIAFAVAMFFQKRGSVHNYYMVIVFFSFLPHELHLHNVNI